jgi:hypothetical protein
MYEVACERQMATLLEDRVLLSGLTLRVFHAILPTELQIRILNHERKSKLTQTRHSTGSRRL